MLIGSDHDETLFRSWLGQFLLRFRIDPIGILKTLEPLRCLPFSNIVKRMIRVFLPSSPVAGAVKALLELQEKHDLLIITKRFGVFMIQHAEETLKNHKLDIVVISSQRKTEEAKKLDLFITDDPEEAERLSKVTTVILLRCKYNCKRKVSEGVIIADSWKHILELIGEM